MHVSQIISETATNIEKLARIRRKWSKRPQYAKNRVPRFIHSPYGEFGVPKFREIYFHFIVTSINYPKISQICHLFFVVCTLERITRLWYNLISFGFDVHFTRASTWCLAWPNRSMKFFFWLLAAAVLMFVVTVVIYIESRALHHDILPTQNRFFLFRSSCRLENRLQKNSISIWCPFVSV